MSLNIVSPFSSIHVNHEFWGALQKDPILISAGAVALGIIGTAVAGPIGLFAGLAVGAIAGIIVGVAIRCIFRPAGSGRDVQYVSALASDPRLSHEVKASIEKIKKFISKSPIFVSQAFELHEIHNQLIIASRSVADKKELQKEWIAFLHRLNGRGVRYPDGSIHPIETDLAIKAASKLKVNFSIEPLDPHSPSAAKEIEEIYKLEAECFTLGTRFTLAQFTSQLRSPLSFCYTAKERASGKLLGLAWGRWEMDASSEPFLHICGLGRRASAAKLGIAEGLMSAVQSYQEATRLPCVLEVRQSNTTAQNLYEKWGYERVEIIPHYYKKPEESAYLMRHSFAAARVA